MLLINNSCAAIYMYMYKSTRVDCGAQTIVRDINAKAIWLYFHKPGGEEVNGEEETRHDVIIIRVS